MLIQSGSPFDLGVFGMTPSTKTNGINLCIDNKKASKPLIEKRRRARINQSLALLKGIVVGTDKPQSSSSRQPKLEKADILEMTVDYVKGLEEKNNLLSDYNSGYDHCLKTVCQFLDRHGELTMKSRLLNHVKYTTGTPLSPSVHSTTDDSSLSCSSRSHTPTAGDHHHLMDFATSSSSSDPETPSSSDNGTLVIDTDPGEVPLDLAVREQRDDVQEGGNRSRNAQLVDFPCGHSLEMCRDYVRQLQCPYCQNMWRPW